MAFADALSLSKDGNSIAIGIPGDEKTLAGEVRVFKLFHSISPHISNNSGQADDAANNNNTQDQDWKQQGSTIQAEQMGDDTALALSLSSDGRTMVVGTDASISNLEAEGAGYSRVYTWNNDNANDDVDVAHPNWIQMGQDLRGRDSQVGDTRGASVSMTSTGTIHANGDGDSVVVAVGAPGGQRGYIDIYEWKWKKQ
jgi:hypothetical protein